MALDYSQFTELLRNAHSDLIEILSAGLVSYVSDPAGQVTFALSSGDVTLDNLAKVKADATGSETLPMSGTVTAGDLVKVVDDSGTAKFETIVTPTVGTGVVFDATSVIGSTVCYAVTADRYVVFYDDGTDLNAQLLSKSGNTLSVVGTPQTIQAGNMTFKAFYSETQDKMVIVYLNSATLYYKVLDITSTTITVGGAVTISAGVGAWDATYNNVSDKMFFAYVKSADDDLYMKDYDFSTTSSENTIRTGTVTRVTMSPYFSGAIFWFGEATIHYISTWVSSLVVDATEINLPVGWINNRLLAYNQDDNSLIIQDDDGVATLSMLNFFLPVDGGVIGTTVYDYSSAESSTGGYYDSENGTLILISNNTDTGTAYQTFRQYDFVGGVPILTYVYRSPYIAVVRLGAAITATPDGKYVIIGKTTAGVLTFDQRSRGIGYCDSVSGSDATVSIFGNGNLSSISGMDVGKKQYIGVDTTLTSTHNRFYAGVAMTASRLRMNA